MQEAAVSPPALVDVHFVGPQLKSGGGGTPRHCLFHLGGGTEWLNRCCRNCVLQLIAAETLRPPRRYETDRRLLCS